MFLVYNLIEEIFEIRKFRGWGISSKMLGFAGIYFRGRKENWNVEIYFRGYF